MNHQYSPLPLELLSGEICCCQPTQDLPQRVELYSPAILVMTDLRQVAAQTIEPNTSIILALNQMREGGVRLLFVVNRERQVIGLISANDIQGERPMQLLQEVGGRRTEILVREVMTPREKLSVARFGDVLKARVGDIVATLEHVGRHYNHVLVKDDEIDNGRVFIRGIFSATQIGRQLGTPIEPVGVANNFAEVEAALHS